MDNIRGVEGTGAVVTRGVLAKKEQVLCAYYVLSAWLSHLVSRMGRERGEDGGAERNVTVSSSYTQGTKTQNNLSRITAINHEAGIQTTPPIPKAQLDRTRNPVQIIFLLPHRSILQTTSQCPHALWLSRASGEHSRRLKGERRVKSGYFFPWLPPNGVT